MKSRIEFIYLFSDKITSTNEIEDVAKQFAKFETMPQFKTVLEALTVLTGKFYDGKIDTLKEGDPKIEAFAKLYNDFFTKYKQPEQKIASTQYNRIYEHGGLGGAILAHWAGFTPYNLLPASYQNIASSVETTFNTNVIGLWQCRVYKIWKWTFYMPFKVQFLDVASVGNTSGHYWNAADSFDNDAADAYSSLR